MFNPIIPHLTEELWVLLGNKCLATHPWPVPIAQFATEENVEIAIQINGKLRTTITVAKDSANDYVEKVATEHEKVQNSITGKIIKKVIVVPNKIVNIVIV